MSSSDSPTGTSDACPIPSISMEEPDSDDDPSRLDDDDPSRLDDDDSKDGLPSVKLPPLMLLRPSYLDDEGDQFRSEEEGSCRGKRRVKPFSVRVEEIIQINKFLRDKYKESPYYLLKTSGSYMNVNKSIRSVYTRWTKKKAITLISNVVFRKEIKELGNCRNRSNRIIGLKRKSTITHADYRTFVEENIRKAPGEKELVKDVGRRAVSVMYKELNDTKNFPMDGHDRNTLFRIKDLTRAMSDYGYPKTRKGKACYIGCRLIEK